MPYHARSRCLGFTLLAAVLLALGGCFSAVWLPDSSGFIYTTSKDFSELRHYDLKTGKSRVLVKNQPGATMWPAVSPDGKRVAVASARRSDDTRRRVLKIYIYDLSGKLVEESPTYYSKNERTNRAKRDMNQVFWSPDGRHIVVSAYEEQFETGIYDLKSRRWAEVAGMPSPVGGTPFPPGEHRFLVTRPKGPGVEILLSDPSGKTESLTADPKAFGSEDLRAMVTFPWAATSYWKGSRAHIESGDRRIVIDAKARTVALQKIADPLAMALDEELIARHKFAQSKYEIRLVEHTAAGPPKRKSRRVELFKRGGETRVLAASDRDLLLVLAPSPDGKWVAARWFMGPEDSQHTALIGHDGSVKQIE